MSKKLPYILVLLLVACATVGVLLLRENINSRKQEAKQVVFQIANITEQRYMAHRMYGTFQIAGRGDGDPYALTRVTPRTAVMDYGDKRTLPLAISAREIAEDICREINSDAGERSFLGVFVCAGDAPTEEELRGAQEKLDEFYRALVAAADREWERSHSFLFIHDLQRRAAARLGIEKEWHYQARETEECPGCGERVKPGVAVCNGP